MSRPLTKPKVIKRPNDMVKVDVEGVIFDPFLPREQKLAILAELIKDPKTTPLEKRALIECHSVLAGDTKDSQTFVLRLEVIKPEEIKNAIESRETKPMEPEIIK